MALTVPEYSIVVMGHLPTPKTSLIIEFVKQEKDEVTDVSTLERQIVVDNQSCFIVLINSDQYGYGKQFCEKDIQIGDAFIIVYDPTISASFIKVPELVNDIMKIKCLEKFPITIVETLTAETYKQSRTVSSQEGKALADKLGCGFVECVPHLHLNTENLFQDIVREIRKLQDRTITKAKEKESKKKFGSLSWATFKARFSSNNFNENSDNNVKKSRRATIVMKPESASRITSSHTRRSIQEDSFVPVSSSSASSVSSSSSPSAPSGRARASTQVFNARLVQTNQENTTQENQIKALNEKVERLEALLAQERLKVVALEEKLAQFTKQA